MQATVRGLAAHRRMDILSIDDVGCSSAASGLLRVPAVVGTPTRLP